MVASCHVKDALSAMTMLEGIEKGKKEVDYNKSAHNYSYCCFFV